MKPKGESDNSDSPLSTAVPGRELPIHEEERFLRIGLPPQSPMMVVYTTAGILCMAEQKRNGTVFTVRISWINEEK